MASAHGEHTAAAAEAAHEHAARHRAGHGGRILSLLVLAALLGAIVLLALDNRQEAQLSWVVGESRAPVVWIVLAAAGVGWLAGLVTSAVVRRRSRARH